MEINYFGLQLVLCGLCSFPCFSCSSPFAKGANVFSETLVSKSWCGVQRGQMPHSQASRTFLKAGRADLVLRFWH